MDICCDCSIVGAKHPKTQHTAYNTPSKPPFYKKELQVKNTFLRILTKEKNSWHTHQQNQPPLTEPAPLTELIRNLISLFNPQKPQLDQALPNELNKQGEIL